MDRVVFFDGVCNLCNSSVDFIIRRDKQGIFKFVSLQSPIASSLLTSHDFDPQALKTMALLKSHKLYTRSNAALEVVRELPGLWPMLYAFKIVPRFLRDGVYSFVSRNRYRWFGKRDTCRVPTPAEKERFLPHDNLSVADQMV